MGRTLLRPGEWRLEIGEQPPREDPAAARREREEEARQNQNRYQERYAGEPAEPRYAIGDWVFIENHHLSNKAAGYNAGLDHKREGPYQIIDHTSGEVYLILKDGRTQKLHGRELLPAPLPRRLQPPATEEHLQHLQPQIEEQPAPGADEQHLIPAHI